MLMAAFVTLGIAVLLGSVLAVLHLRAAGAARGTAALAALHALIALGGFACLLAALRGPPRGLDSGTAEFGIIATVLVALAALLGGGFLASRLLKRRITSGWIGLHATLAVAGFVVLAAYLLAG
jgi:membrane protease YdiL (CAAX protease family)